MELDDEELKFTKNRKKCSYCEIEEVGNRAKRYIRKNQRMDIVIGTNMFDKNKYYLEVIPKTMTGECIDINYCPFCGRKLR